MRVRLYSPIFPYPLTEGAHHVIFGQIRDFLKNGIKLEVVTWKDGAIVLAEKWRRLQKNEAENIPFANLKITDLSKTVIDREDVIRRNTRVLKSLFRPTSSTAQFYYPPALNFCELNDDADLEIYHYSHAASFALTSTAPRRAVHFHNLEGDLIRLRADEQVNPLKCIFFIHNAEKTDRMEAALAQSSVELWFLSGKDLKDFCCLHNGIDLPRIKFFPPTIDPDCFETRKEQRLLQERTGPIRFGFLGSLQFTPNRLSFEWILQEVAPYLSRQGFTGEIRIFGKRPPRKLMRAASDFAFIKFRGFVEDLDVELNFCDMLLCPHVAGSGVRTKLIHGISSSIPTLANSYALEGLPSSVRRLTLLEILDVGEEWAEMMLRVSRNQLRERVRTCPPPGDLYFKPSWLDLIDKTP